MTDHETKALTILTEQKALVRPGHFGTLLWPATRRTDAAFARPAGKVLNRLKALGFTEWVHDEPWFGWRATEAGRRRAKENPSIAP